jgi:hypothetical protein
MSITLRGGGIALLASLAGCTAGPGPDDDTGLQWPPPKAWQVEGEAGSVVVTRLDRPENPRVDVYGIFADTTQGYQTAGACAQFEMPCVEELPPPGEFRRLNNENFRPRGSQVYRWVGDSITVGGVRADFVYDAERDMAYYRGAEESRPLVNQALRFGGEWADFDLPAVEFVNQFTVTGPILEPGERLDMSGADIEFTWESDRRQEVWLWIQGPRTRRVYRLNDTGSFTLNPNNLNLDTTEVVEVGLAAARRRSFDVAGNSLEVLTLTGAGWTGNACGAFLDVPLEGNTLPEGDPPQPVFMGWSFQGILDEGIRDYIDPDTGEEASARLRFEFFDESFDLLCEVQYDASLGVRRDPLIVESGAQLAQTYQVGLFNGLSGCPAVDPLIYGFSDLRTYIEQFDWGFAIGEMIELEQPISQALGESWPNQSQFIYSVYWTQDGLFGDEQGYGYALDTDVCWTGNNQAALFTPDFEEPLPPAYYFTFPYFVEPIL